MKFQLSVKGNKMKQSLLNEKSSDIFSWKEIKENPFELFKSEILNYGFLINQENIDSKIDWAIEYEMIYNSQLMEI
ncbi:hypothetical protein [Ignavibacterium sp.]|jgi:septum formation inhibitor MinC|uniref:hypothetical protein n=1 Tax=Ignavibacterium sp. TaxID=2651167 RepID=UPI00260C1C0E|nr:hypothetical protein [Ignavibacterium sp.]